MNLRPVRSLPPLVLSLAVSLLVAACGGDDGPTGPARAKQMTANAGNGQSAVAGTAVATAPSVRITDAGGSPVQGVSVTFSVASGGGSVTGAAATSNAQGIATVGSWVLGSSVGANTLTASSAGLTGSPVTFTATATAGAAAAMTKQAGDTQTATVGTSVAVAPSVKVVDAGGNPVSGVSVTFGVTSGGGSVTGGAATTGADGIATVGSWTLGTAAGANALTATAGSLSATFTATAEAGAASVMGLVEGDGQTATVGTAVAVLPAVSISDAGGNPVAGVTVTFAVTAGGGSVLTADVPTNAGGVAATIWQLGTTPGTNELTATVDGLTGSPVTFMAQGTVDAPASMTKEAGDGQSAVAGTAVTTPPSVKVVDQYGNPVPGVQVDFAVSAGGGSVTGEMATTGANGIAAVGSWTLGATAGANELTATAGSLSATFTATGTAGAATTIAVNAGDNQSATVGTTVAVAPSVKVTDAGGNPVSGVDVTFEALDGFLGSNFTTETVATGADGIATVSEWKLKTTSGANSLTATSAGLTGSPVTFTATSLAGPATSMGVYTGVTATDTVASAHTPSVQVLDAGGNPVQGHVVTFNVTAGGGSVSDGSTSGATVSLATDTLGIAQVTWKLGTAPGTNTLEASAIGDGGTALTGSPVVNQIDGTVGFSTVVSIVAGDGQSAVVGTAVATPPSVKVVDGFGNPKAGVDVAFVVTDVGTGVVSQGANSGPIVNVNTDAAGIAALDSWTLGQASGIGNNTVEASAAGSNVPLGTPAVTFTATALPDAATEILLVAGNGQTAEVNTAVATPPVVQVRDQYGNGVPQYSVTWTVGQGGGSLNGSGSSATVPTDENGNSSVAWTLGGTAGETQALLATADPAVTGSPVIFAAGATPVGAAKLVALSATSQTGTVDTDVDFPPIVKVTDKDGNPTAGVEVTFFVFPGTGGCYQNPAQACSAQAMVYTDADGIAGTGGVWILGPEAERTNVLVATVAGIAPVVFEATTVADAPRGFKAESDTAGLVGIIGGGEVAQAPRLHLVDQFGNRVKKAGIQVAFSVVSGNGVIRAGADTAATVYVYTDQEGSASLDGWALGDFGAQSVEATAGPGNPGDVLATLLPAKLTFNAFGQYGLALLKQPPTSGTAGGNLNPGPQVVLYNHSNQIQAVQGVEIAVTLVSDSPTSATLSGTTTRVTGVDGTANFPSLSIDQAGSFRLRFVGTGTPATTIQVESNTIVVN